MIAVKKPLDLVRAGRYTSPADGAAIVPEVYGSFLTGGVAGAVPAVQIDTVTFVYAAAAHAVGSITAVYIGDVEVTIGVHVTVNLANDFQSQGVIATLTFIEQPAGVVSWRGEGKQESAATITNAISQLKDLLTTRAQSVGAALDETLDYDVSMRERARSDVEAFGYQTAFVIEDEREAGEWITEILFNVLGHWFIRGDNKLCLYIERAPVINDTDVYAHLIAARDVVNGDYGVTMSGDFQHLVNAVTADYLWSWTLGQALSRLVTPQAEVSFNAHGEVRKNITLRGHRVQAHVETWCDALFARQDFRTRVEGAIVSFTVEGNVLARATEGDYIALTWFYGPTRDDGEGYVNEVLRIITLRHAIDGPNGTTFVEAIDTGTFAPNRTDVIEDIEFPDDDDEEEEEEEPELVEAFSAGTWFPGVPIPTSGQEPSALPSYAYDSVGDGTGFVFQAPKSGTLHSFQFQCNGDGDPGGHTIRGSFQSLNARGLPDGVVDQYRVILIGSASPVWVVPGAFTSDGTDGGAKRTVVAGEYLAIVLEYTALVSGALVGSFGASPEPIWTAGYQVTNDNGAGWTKSPTFGKFVLRYDDDTYANDVEFHAPSDSIRYTYAVDTAARDEIGMKFTVPTRMTINQLAVHVDLDGAADLVLYDNGAVMTGFPVALLARPHALAGPNVFLIPIAPTTLVPGHTYRLTLKPTTTTTIKVSAYIFAAGYPLEASPGGASNCFMCERVDDGPWTDHTDRKIRMSVGIQDWPEIP
jgi:hypothetical protein